MQPSMVIIPVVPTIYQMPNHPLLQLSLSANSNTDVVCSEPVPRGEITYFLFLAFISQIFHVTRNKIILKQMFQLIIDILNDAFHS